MSPVGTTLRLTEPQRLLLSDLRDRGLSGLVPNRGEWLIARNLEKHRLVRKVGMYVYITELGEMVCKVEGI